MEQNHIIHKVVVEVSVNNKEKAFEIKDNISSFLTMDIFPKIESCLNDFQAKLPSHVIQITRLNVNIDESHTSLNTNLENSITTSFNNEITEIVNTKFDNESSLHKEISLLKKEEQLLQTFLHFLKSGSIPWWDSTEKPIAILEPKMFNKIVSSNGFAHKLVHLMQNIEVEERIINQLTDNQIKQICQKIIQKNVPISLEINLLKKLWKQFNADRKSVWSLILDISTISFSNTDKSLENYIKEKIMKMFSLSTGANITGTENEIWEIILTIFPSIDKNDRVINVASKNNKSNKINKKLEETGLSVTGEEEGTTLKKRNEKEKENIIDDNLLKEKENFINIPLKKTSLNNSKEKTEAYENGYHVQNAGLVIIHPFISNLFKRCNLMDPKTKKLTKPEVCIHLLHYIATGKTNQPESNMLFEKFLCNIPLHKSINRHVRLSKKQKAEADKVIEAVLYNWDAMKKSSVGLLQYEFLQRQGKLTLKDTQVLTLERKTQDILMDKMSWGLGLIKLPWQKKFIYINW
ncbi:contractile injection system tape measure protein [Flavobacterium sp. RHBU_3]|uniref:contractile injection system tape measure protein n=1 Tax=Flavobacterium sp. RHBU_3 TaxID=3391184 RepID=UPI003984EEE6